MLISSNYFSYPPSTARNARTVTSRPSFLGVIEGTVLSRKIPVFDNLLHKNTELLLARVDFVDPDKASEFSLYNKLKEKIAECYVYNTSVQKTFSSTNIPNMLEYYANNTFHGRILTIDYIGHNNYERLNEYKGVGTNLMLAAVQEGINRGTHGHIVLFAQNLLKARYSGESPIPFYYKFGLRSNPHINVQIEHCLRSGDYSNMPDAIPMYLHGDKRKQLIEQLSRQPVFEEPFKFWC